MVDSSLAIGCVPRAARFQARPAELGKIVGPGHRSGFACAFSGMRSRTRCRAEPEHTRLGRQPPDGECRSSARAAELGLDLVVGARGGRELRERQPEHVVCLFAAAVTAMG